MKGFKGGAGALDRLITLQALPDPSGTRNDIGELLASPADDIVDIKAAYEKVGDTGSGREFPESDRRHAETTARFRIRYRNDINVQTLPKTHRVTYCEDYDASPVIMRIYDIQYAGVEGRRQEIHIHVSEIV